MLKLDPCPSHSWWWDSHNSPKHSKWLQSNLRELDEKVKEMLKVIEEDADSFAQRAEMYYEKRPKLLNLVEEFYRAYRSLAERYDHLTGEIRQNIPRALQLQFGLSCDSPRPPSSATAASPNGGAAATIGGAAAASRHHTHHQSSPLRNSSTNLFPPSSAASSSATTTTTTPPPSLRHHPSSFTTPEKLIFTHPTPDIQHIKTLALHRPASIETQTITFASSSSSTSSSDDGLSSSSDSDVGDHSNLVDGLRQQIETLAQEKKLVAESLQEAAHCNTRLLEEVKLLEVELERLRQQIETLAQEKKLMAESLQEATHSNTHLLEEVKLLEVELEGSRKDLRSIQSRLDELLLQTNTNSSSSSSSSNNSKSSEVILQKQSKEDEEEDNSECRQPPRIDICTRKDEEVQEVLPILEEEYDYSAGEEEPPAGLHEIAETACQNDSMKDPPESISLGSSKIEPEVARIISNLENQVVCLMEENERQKASIEERGEEKKEAIRQLCYAMDVLKCRNEKLQEVIRELRNRKKRHGGGGGGGGGEEETANTFLFDWGKLFRGEWRSCRKVQQLTVAL